MNKLKALALGLLLAGGYVEISQATDISLPPKPADPKATATADADANANAEASAAATATASSGGNTLSVVQVRQAPALAQGGLYLAGCGFAGNAGGSQASGAAFLGLQFITPGCHDLMQIQNEAAFGNVKTACELNRLTRQGQRNLQRLKKAGKEPEPCPSAIAQPAPPLEPKPTVVVLTGESCASNSERVDRVLEKCVAK